MFENPMDRILRNNTADFSARLPLPDIETRWDVEAESFFDSLVEIWESEKKIAETNGEMITLEAIVGSATVTVQRIQYHNPYMIYIQGVLGNGAQVTLMSHYASVQVLVSRSTPEEDTSENRQIGYQVDLAGPVGNSKENES